MNYAQINNNLQYLTYPWVYQRKYCIPFLLLYFRHKVWDLKFNHFRNPLKKHEHCDSLLWHIWHFHTFQFLLLCTIYCTISWLCVYCLFTRMSDHVLLFGCDFKGNTAAYILQFDILLDFTINLGIKTVNKNEYI